MYFNGQEIWATGSEFLVNDSILLYMSHDHLSLTSLLVQSLLSPILQSKT